MKIPRFAKRLSRIAIGLAVGAALGWFLGGLYNGQGLGESHALAQSNTSHTSSPLAPLKPDAQAKWIAGHLLAGIALVFFSGLVIGLLSSDNAKDPMDQAAKKDAEHH